MTLCEALKWVIAVADEGTEPYKEEYEKGTIEEAISIVDNFIDTMQDSDK